MHRDDSMNQTSLAWEDSPPALALDQLMDRHGAWATLRALPLVLLRRRTRRLSAEALPDHLRRDIGLPERDEPTPPLRDLWP